VFVLCGSFAQSRWIGRYAPRGAGCRTLTDNFEIRITIVNLSEKTTTIPHLQAVASLYVRFKIHDGYDGYTDGLSSSFEGKLTEEKLKLLNSAQIGPDKRLTPA
jgi:hypothetical protein